MPSPFLTNARRFLQKQTVALFGDQDPLTGAPKLIWWPAAPGNNPDYTVRVECGVGMLEQSAIDLSGVLQMATDGQAFHCTLADFPFLPEPGQTFLYGPAASDGATVTPGSPKFLIKTAKSFGEQITLIAQLHGTAPEPT